MKYLKYLLFFLGYLFFTASLVFARLADIYQGVNRSLFNRRYNLDQNYFTATNINIYRVIIVVLLLMLIYNFLKNRDKMLQFILSFSWGLFTFILLLNYNSIDILSLPYLTMAGAILFGFHLMAFFLKKSKRGETSEASSG
ncbi:hypothetical protein I0Q91_00170 [Halanaerobiaceae bacterium Z-7014]|uniref:Uncharacterized protein n=1 Tax=Halonatronomonas betaini TaxID=2778430 RepID=A0A931F7G7_9FIRM|nr:hypothetical protein [Halonatronomonas betaini]MBF8435478.1 hypothetical protein [Halonatronomonas betaini]